MPRVMIVLLLGLLLNSSVRAEEVTTDDPPQLALRVHVIEFEPGWLKKINFDRRPSNGFLLLDDIEAYFVLNIIMKNNKDKSVYARPKVTFPDGRVISVSNGLFDDAAKRMIVRDGVWLHVRPIAFELTPRIVPGDAVSLTLKYSLNHEERTRGPSTVPAGMTVLVLLDGPRNGVQLAAMITPRIISK